MRITVFYFSGTGNTWWCADALKSELEKLQNKVDVYSLENPILYDKDFLIDKIKESEQIVIGFPTYGSDMPYNVREFVARLPKVQDNKQIAFFCTQAGYTGDGNVYFKENLEEKGYNFLQSIQITMTTNFNVAMFPFSLMKPASGAKLEKKKIKALKRVKKLANAINEKKKYIIGTGIYYAFGKIQRYFFNKHEIATIKYFKFDKSKCVKCGLCIKNCPTENLFIDKANNLNWVKNRKCILCCRCYNLCPENAIQFGRKIQKNDKCIRYKGPVENLKISDIRK